MTTFYDSATHTADCTLKAVGLLPVSGCGDARVAPPCPTTLCVGRHLPYLTLPRGPGVSRSHSTVSVLRSFAFLFLLTACRERKHSRVSSKHELAWSRQSPRLSATRGDPYLRPAILCAPLPPPIAGHEAAGRAAPATAASLSASPATENVQ